ncbi:MAG TPA: TaqI-like C-terminal specificity domain-containing protein [Pyrinomonadaceae bacterium]|jgi:hypothetical protein
MSTSRTDYPLDIAATVFKGVTPAQSVSPPAQICELIERFNRNRDDYRFGRYHETQLRREFIDPFFEALGWDVNNSRGYAETYKEVIHEDALRIGATVSAPDYSFRVGGMRKFFVEAKRPSVNLREDLSPAFQLRRYAWSAKLPLSILTDFEEFVVYDCRVKPAKTDKPSTARTLYLTCEEYLERWGEITGIFSREAVLKGSFDKYAEVSKTRRGTLEVDADFLATIESWRENLARNIALRNLDLTRRELNFAVGRTIDRIVFLRICEDRGIEPPSQLKNLLNGEHVYSRLYEIFLRADQKYNSGLFHFERERDRKELPDVLTPNLAVDDRVLKEIIRNLYLPESPYEFSVLPADILGQVYEQFLGKVIRLTAGHRAVVDDKPEVKKAGGVYYTPTYVVEYIVRETVGKLLEGKTPRQVARLRICDAASGSGSVLLGVYQHLLDWHRDWYVKDGPEKHTKEVYQAAGGEWRLTTAEKKRILLANVYGVDVDPQAVEVTKLSLLLKVLEGESEQTLAKQLKMFHKERALPDLENNIKSGNSLIGPDFYRNAQSRLLDEEKQEQVNVFSWEKEFPKVFEENGGFDAVIGNPPYIRVRGLKEFAPEQIDYLESHYKCATHVWDVYLLFFERALELLREGGRVGFIVPIQTLHQPNCESLRSLLYEQTAIEKVVDLSRIKVFQGAIVKNCILICKKGRSTNQRMEVFQPDNPRGLLTDTPNEWPQKAVKSNPGLSLKLSLLSPQKLLCEKLMERSWSLDELCYVTFGLRSSAKGVGQGTKDRLITSNPQAPGAKPYLEGRDIDRFAIKPTGNYIRYIPEEMYSPRTPALFENKKIVSRSMLSNMRLVATLDEEGYYVEQSLVCILPHGIANEGTPAATLPLEFILGVINSRLQNFFFATYIIDHSLGGGLIHATPGSQAKLLVPKAKPGQIDIVVELVKRLLSLQQRLLLAKTGQDRNVIERQLEAADELLNRKVYEIYGLTDDEIATIERATI